MPTLKRSKLSQFFGIHLALTIVASAALALLTLSPAQAQNVPRAYAGIVVDAKTGQTLYNSNADNLRYPASLTKVMTLYILFQELEAGRIKLDTKFNVSAHAAAAVPTKLYVPRGSTIAVEDAIKALVTLSANDVARVIAENISGTESQFAQRMTATARALGMSKTTYRNASGLPDSGQVTTARDQAILASAVYQHFPRYYSYFQTTSFRYGGKTYGNHNRLLGQNGVDGIKTGFIRASGYNLMTASRHNNRHIVVIGLGYNTGAERNAKVGELVRRYLPQARQGDYWREAVIQRPGLLGTGVAVAALRAPAPLGGLPPRRPAHLMPQVATASAAAPIDLDAPTQVASIAPTPVPAPANVQSAEPEHIPFQVVSADEIPTRPGEDALQQANIIATGFPATTVPVPADDPIGAWINETLKLGPVNDVGSLQPGQVLRPPAPIGRPAGQPIDLMTTNSAETAAISGWIVQIGAAPSEDGANQMLADAASKISPLTDYRRYVERIERNGQVFFRARFAGFADRSQARTMCDEIAKADLSCLAIQG